MSPPQSGPPWQRRPPSTPRATAPQRQIPLASLADPGAIQTHPDQPSLPPSLPTSGQQRHRQHQPPMHKQQQQRASSTPRSSWRNCQQRALSTPRSSPRSLVRRGILGTNPGVPAAPIASRASSLPKDRSSSTRFSRSASRGRCRGSNSPSRDGSTQHRAASTKRQARPPGSIECRVRVVVRFRPLVVASGSGPSAEVEPGSRAAFNVCSDSRVVESADHAFSFEFDHVFGPEAPQFEVYREVGRPMVSDVLDGYNGTILVYGQTGTGKTHSTFGPDTSRPDMHGLAPRAARHLFGGIRRSATESSFVLRCSMLEIYCEQLRDLQNPANRELRIQETAAGGVVVAGLSEECVACEEDVLELLQTGDQMRAVSSAQPGHYSSRSHVLFFLTCEQKMANGNEIIGKLSLVDLAGSEKHPARNAAVTPSSALCHESRKINCALTSLSQVVQALAEQRQHIPYRSSQLTRLLQDALGGNCKTTMLVTCSSAAQHAAETLASLRLASSARGIRNHVSVNFVRSREHLVQLVIQLKREQAAVRSEAHRLGVTLQSIRCSASNGDICRQEDLHRVDSAATCAPAAVGLGTEVEDGASEFDHANIIYIPPPSSEVAAPELEASLQKALEAKEGHGLYAELSRLRNARIERHRVRWRSRGGDAITLLQNEESAYCQSLEAEVEQLWAALRTQRLLARRREAEVPHEDDEDMAFSVGQHTSRSSRGIDGSAEALSTAAELGGPCRGRSPHSSDGHSCSRATSVGSLGGGSVGLASAGAIRRSRRRRTGPRVLCPVRRCDVERHRRERAASVGTSDDDRSDVFTAASPVGGVHSSCRTASTERQSLEQLQAAVERQAAENQQQKSAFEEEYRHREERNAAELARLRAECSPRDSVDEEIALLRREDENILLEIQAAEKAKHEEHLQLLRQTRERIMLEAELVSHPRFVKTDAVDAALSRVSNTILSMRRSRGGG